MDLLHMQSLTLWQEGSDEDHSDDAHARKEQEDTVLHVAQHAQEALSNDEGEEHVGGGCCGHSSSSDLCWLDLSRHQPSQRTPTNHASRIHLLLRCFHQPRILGCLTLSCLSDACVQQPSQPDSLWSVHRRSCTLAGGSLLFKLYRSEKRQIWDKGIIAQERLRA